MFPTISYSLYKINLPKYWLVRDQPASKPYTPASKNSHKEMLFHVAAGDYITTLASILRFFEESSKNIETTKEMRELEFRTIRGVISDLLYLNKDYTIVPKDGYEKTFQKSQN